MNNIRVCMCDCSNKSKNTVSSVSVADSAKLERIIKVQS